MLLEEKLHKTLIFNDTERVLLILNLEYNFEKWKIAAAAANFASFKQAAILK